MTNFRLILQHKIAGSIYNNWGRENFDPTRFSESEYRATSAVETLKLSVKRAINYKSSQRAEQILREYDDKIPALASVYDFIEPESKPLFVDIVAYRILGAKKIKIDGQAKPYLKLLANNPIRIVEDGEIDTGFMGVRLNHLQFDFEGRTVELWYSKPGVIIDFFLEQYACKLPGHVIEARPGNVVLDCGGCWGDTAVYFAAKLKGRGKVYSFEFIPGNIKIHGQTVALNPDLSPIIKLVPFPVSDKSGIDVYYKDNGPGSHISADPFSGQTGQTSTISIDDFVVSENLAAVDFIKIDIEGEDLSALRGAVQTLKRYRPTLAVAIYHNGWDDLHRIPEFLHSLNLGYKFYLGHYTIHAEETILFAQPL